jgi:3-oxoacyl-[acyl-carrier-protein] synthase-3
MKRSVITSTGSYLPKKVITNDDLSKTLDTSDDWIFSRVGIKTRHIADEQETTAFMGAEAAKLALKKSGMLPDDIDGIIVATTTPDSTFPSVAAKIQRALMIKAAFAFDVQAVCSGFVYALALANSMLRTYTAKNILVIAAEKMSKLVNWNDRNTAVLFGDGAGAVLLSTQDTDSGIIDCTLHADGSLEDILCTSGGVASTQTAGHILMNGREVFKYAIDKMPAVSKDILNRNDLTSADVQWVIPHQANYRIMTSLMDKLGMPMTKLLSTIDLHANTSAATIPIVMDYYSKTFKKGDLILMAAVGGGLTWGAALIRW